VLLWAGEWRLSRKRRGSRPREGAGELGENRQVGVKANPLDAPHAEGRKPPSILETTELSLD